MNSTFTSRTSPAMFRLRWFGYDRAEVDEFLRRTAADRRRLQTDLAQLEVLLAGHAGERRRELERLAALRVETARSCNVSTGDLHTVAKLSSTRQNALRLSQQVRQVLKPTAILSGLLLSQPRFRWPFTAVPLTRRTSVLAVSISAAALFLIFLGVHYWSPTSQAAAVNVASTQENLQPVASQPVAAPEPVAQQVEGLLLTLTAQGACWIRTIIDGNPPLERLLKPNETLLLRAKDEVVLRVGDAAALSLTINNQLAKPFGAPGEVVTTRITRSNYLGFLSNN
jgi:DivIVA domain-containing protein